MADPITEMTHPITEPKGATPSGSLARGVYVLKSLAAKQPATAAELMKDLDMTRSTMYRILHALSDEGFVEFDSSQGTYRLGVELISIGLQAQKGLSVSSLAPKFLNALADESGETAYMAVLSDLDMVYVARHDSPRPIKMSADLGSRRPIYATALGKAHLASLPPTELEHYLSLIDPQPLTPNTILSKEELRREIARIREEGYSVDNSENELGVSCIGACVIGPGGRPEASISVAGPSDRILPRERKLGPLIANTAQEFSRALRGGA